MLRLVSADLPPSVLRGAARFAARDAALALGSAGLWWLDATFRSGASEGVLATLLALGAGLSAAGCAFLVHEWGHLAGSLLSGARVEFPARLGSLFLFMFDVSKNDRRQFLAMSFGGYAGSLVAIALLLTLLPFEALSGKVGLAAAALGMLAIVFAELPVTVRVLRGGPLPTVGPVYVRAS
jgi:hypothetical protein